MREILGVIGCAHQADKSTCPYCKADLLTTIISMFEKRIAELDQMIEDWLEAGWGACPYMAPCQELTNLLSSIRKEFGHE